MSSRARRAVEDNINNIKEPNSASFIKDPAAISTDKPNDSELEAINIHKDNPSNSKARESETPSISPPASAVTLPAASATVSSSFSRTRKPTAKSTEPKKEFNNRSESPAIKEAAPKRPPKKSKAKKVIAKSADDDGNNHLQTKANGNKLLQFNALSSLY
jgi:hypothetical protein